MAIEKNTAKPATKAPTKAPAKPATTAKPPVKASAKPAAKPAPAKAPTKPATTAKAAAPESLRVSRKDLAASIVAKVKATGKAVPEAIAEIMVVAYEESVAEALAAGKEVNLPGFGKFVVTDKEEAQKRNPSNGEMVTVAAHKAPRFKVGTGLKRACNPDAPAKAD